MFSQLYRRYVLGALTAVWMLNLVDRALMMLLLQPIKEDMHLTDTEAGFVTGIAFGLLYAVVGVPIARRADHGNRAAIASLAIGVWGLTAMACVFVGSYAQLVVARMGAAIGEAGCKPPTYSLIGDYFPEPAARTRAMAVYMAGGPLAALLSFVLGGWLNELYGWRETFLVMGIPGLLLAVLLKLTVVDPRMRIGPLQPMGVPQLPPIRRVFAVLWRQRSCRNLSAALILLYTMGLGLGPWYAAFMMRSHGMRTRQLGLWLGLIFSVAGIAGTLVGGQVASRWLVNSERGQMRLSAISVAALPPCFVAFLTVPGRYQALAALVPLTMTFYVFLGPSYALMQRLVPDEMRATGMAVVMLLSNLIGMGAGPQIVGIVSDMLRPALGAGSLRYSMLMMSFVALWAAYHFWMVGDNVEGDLESMALKGRKAVA